MKTLSADKEPSVYRRALPQFLAVGCKNLVLLGYGLTLGFPTIIIPAIQGGDARDSSKGEFVLTKNQISWLSSINLLCVPLGCFLSGMFTEPTGKRRAMQLVNIPMIVSWMLFYFSTSVTYLYAGLCLSGLGGGLMEAPVLTYVAEVTQPQFRGMLAATGTTCVITGILIQFILGTLFSWRTVALISSFLPVFTIIALCFVPESPHWLITKGRKEEAKRALCWLRGWVPFSRVETEFNEIHAVLDARRREAESYRQLPYYKRFEPFTKRGFFMPFILVSVTFFVGHFSGITPVQTYAVQIFNTLKAPIDKYYATILLGGAELIGAFACVLLVHVTGKRKLVFSSLIGTGVCFFATATYAHFLQDFSGVSVQNIVANYSTQDMDLSSYINERNLTDAFNNLTNFENNSRNFENAMRLGNTTDSSSTYNASTEITTEAFQSSTVRPKRMNILSSSDINNTNAIDDGIILTIPNVEENKYLWLPLSLLITGAVLSHLGIRIIPWMLIGEVYPVNVRSASSGLSGGIGYIFAFLSNKVFLQMVSTLTLAGTFWLYSAVAFIGCIILYFTLPETENRTLLEIEEHFLGKKLLSDKKPTSTTYENGVNNNHSMNGVDVVTVVPQSIIKTQPQNGSNRLSVNETNNEDRLSIPEISERQPGAGSKRYKHRVSDANRSRNSVALNEDDVHDTRL